MHDYFGFDDVAIDGYGLVVEAVAYGEATGLHMDAMNSWDNEEVSLMSVVPLAPF